MKFSKFHIISSIAILLLLYFIAEAIRDNFSWWPATIVFSLYIILLVTGSVFIRFNFYLTSKNKLSLLQPDNTIKKIAITFDDGPAAYTNQILDILKKEEVKATFFVIGKNINDREPILKRMKEEGHLVGNHSYNHGFNFDWQSSSSMQREIEQTNNLIKKTIENETILFRPPYGVTNPNLAKAIRKSGMQSIGWSLRSMDTVTKDKKKLLNKILSKIKDNDIVLLHDHCAITADILPELIKELKYRQYEFTQP